MRLSTLWTLWQRVCLTLITSAVVVCGSATLAAEDWPEWRGRGRVGVWSEQGIMDEFPAEGLTVKWRVAIKAGFAGPAVAGGRVFVSDGQRIAGNRFTERILCLDEETGHILWTHEWQANYAGLQYLYAIGPRATPTVDEGRVYVVGSVGHLWTLDAATGKVLWHKDYVRDYQTTVPVWGVAAAPIIDGALVICLVGGEPDAKVVAFDKITGEERWRALSSDWEMGYNQPVIIQAGGTRQLIIWDPRAITSLNPETGRTYWAEPFQVTMGMNVATAVWNDTRLMVTAFYNGARMLKLDAKQPGATLLWKANSESEIVTDTIHPAISTPVLDGDHVYGLDSYGQMRCLDANTGRRIWESMDVTNEKARHATAFIVRNGDRYFINNDRGDLIIAKLSPEGFKEISRTSLIRPTSETANRRKAGAVNWSHPAYVNRHVIARNDEEIIRVSLEKH